MDGPATPLLAAGTGSLEALYALGIAVPVLVTLAVWWASTGAVFALLRLPAELRRAAFACVSVLALVALWGAGATASSPGVASVLCGFVCAILLWGWQEFAFLGGFVTGPSRNPCPEGLGLWSRFGRATATLIWHELAILVGALALVAVSQGGANPVALETYLVLWVARISAKLNLFLGVRNRSIELLPEALSHLGGYFAKARFNALFPVSVTLGTLGVAVLVGDAQQPGVSPADQARLLMVATLLTLAVLEHWFLVLPLRLEALWAPILGRGDATIAHAATSPPSSSARGSSAPPAAVRRGVSQPVSTGAVP